MTNKVITWVDLQGRYRVLAPAYNDRKRAGSGETEDECLERVWAKIVSSGKYGIPIDHPRFYVEPADLQERSEECCGHSFRYGVKSDGPHGDCDARDGAWEMDTDGLPKVNMARARGVHMDKIRAVRDAELVKKDIPFMRAVEAGDAGVQSTIATEKQTLRDIPQTFDLTTDTPIQLQAKWPSELPARE